MQFSIQKFIEQLVPFLVLGIAIALLVGLFIMLSYVLVWGLFIGGILWIIATIKNKLSGKSKHDAKGRIIDQK